MKHRPSQLLASAGKQYPIAWRESDRFRAMRGQGLPKWPAWCYLPMAGWYAIVSEGGDMPPERVGDVARLAALGAWRVSQGIYRFDQDLAEALHGSTLKGEIPAEVLLRLPEWGIYVETPGMEFGGSTMYGFFAHMEWDANTGRKELRLLFDTDADLVPVPVHIGPWTVTEAIDRMWSEAGRHTHKLGIELPPGVQAMDAIQRTAAALHPFLAMLLYICSDEPDIIDREQPGAQPERPKPKYTKKYGWRLFPPSRPRIWTVGDTIGQSIRAGHQSSPSASDSSADRSSPRPHIRRGHWHGYWHGPRDGERKFRYHWIPPIVVAGQK